MEIISRATRMDDALTRSSGVSPCTFETVWFQWLYHSGSLQKGVTRHAQPVDLKVQLHNEIDRNR